jgi:hypothetical protein
MGLACVFWPGDVAWSAYFPATLPTPGQRASKGISNIKTIKTIHTLSGSSALIGKWINKSQDRSPRIQEE